MGKKNKKGQKGQGKEKTLQKTEKNALKKSKKELANLGEDDIEKMIAEFQASDKKKNQVMEEKCGPPSARCNMSLTPHPDKEELIMFGGEFYTGKKMFMYNDLFLYNIKKNSWMKVSCPNAPPPRSSHQAVGLKQGGGQLWVFGGEFASPSQAQFYHYKDLWVYHLKDKRWEKINSPGGPSARSGHRMVQCKRQLIVFGGFHDNIRDYKYFNDVYTFNLDTYTWSEVKVSGVAPAPRSGCVMAALQDQGRVLVYGGYSKERVKKDVDSGRPHQDMFHLVPEGKVKDDAVPTKWKWVSVKQSGSRPSARSGMSLAVTHGNRAICFGGVFDKEENEETLTGTFYNDMFSLELEKGKWYDICLRGKKPDEKKKRRKKQTACESEEVGGDAIDEEDDEEGEEEMDVGEGEIQKLSLETETSVQMDVDGATVASGDVTGVEEQVFKVTLGKVPAPCTDSSVADGHGRDTDVFMPHPRMNTLLAVKNSVLFLFGGVYEDGDKQHTFSDFCSIDLHKLDEWDIIIENDLKQQVWEGSDSSSDEDDEEGAVGGDDEEEEDSDTDDDMDISFDDAPEKSSSESVSEYFERTKEYWIGKARTYCTAEDMKLSDRKLEKLAKEMCQEAF